MTRSISEAINNRRARGERALIPFFTADFPDRKRFSSAVVTTAASGADVIEIGFPHSDPLADGPVIQHASHVALANGFSTASGLALIRELAASISQPLVVMGYLNPLLKFGLARFVRAASRSGVSGLIVPDLIAEESDDLRRLCREHRLDLIPLVTPTTPPARIARIAAAASGFIYYVSITGVSGTAARLNGHIHRAVAAIRRSTDLPVCVGFGINSPESAGEAARHSDGVIIGSRLLQLIDSDRSDTNSNLRQFLLEVRMQLRGPR